MKKQLKKGTVDKRVGDSVRDEFLVFGGPRIEQDEIDEVVECLKSGWLLCCFPVRRLSWNDGML